MAEQYLDPWTRALPYGPWKPAYDTQAGPCHYCRKPAAMNEPGKPWKAHKVCALGNPSTGALNEWDGQENHSAGPGKLGCGTPVAGQEAHRWCAGTGTALSCVLCPRSPTYWNPENPVEFFGTITD